jgi:hypothetical protein
MSLTSRQDFHEIENKNTFLSKEIERMSELIQEQKSFPQNDALTFKPQSSLCDKCNNEDFQQSQRNPNNFDFELERDIQMNFKFEKEALREDVKKEVAQSFEERIQELTRVLPNSLGE